MESNAVRALVARALETELEAFQETLRQCPDLMFGIRPTYGHSVAWHALHTMDWTRCMFQWGLKGVNPEITYGYLGFENEPWARVVKGPTLAYEQEPADKIRNVVYDVCEEALDAIRHAPQERFTSKAM